MTVGQRLYLMVLPGLLGVGLAGALAYWGEYGRQAPSMFLVLAVAVTIVSAAAAWYNARYITRRLDQLAHAPGGSEFTKLLSPLTGALGPDALDTIEGSVTALSARIADLAHERDVARDAAAGDRAQLAALLAGAARASRAAMDDARLPLHILAEAPFGELNDNQLELLADARAAAERGDRALARLEDAGALVGGTTVPRAERVSLTEVLRSIEPQLKAAAVRAHASISLDIQPALPRVVGDRERLREVVLALALDAIETRAANEATSPVHLGADVVGGYPRLTIRPAVRPQSLEAHVAMLALPALGMRARRDDDTLLLDFSPPA